MRAFTRVLVATAMTCSRSGAFVIPTMAGTSYNPLKEALPSTEYKTIPVPVLPLSREDARSLVQTTFKNGEAWLQKGRSFEILLDTVRGNPRALWALKVELAERDPNLPFNALGIIESLLRPIEDTFRTDTWGSVEEGLLTLLSAIIGIPVLPTEVLSQPGSKRATARDFQMAGLVTGRPAPIYPSPLWVKRWST